MNIYFEYDNFNTARGATHVSTTCAMLTLNIHIHPLLITYLPRVPSHPQEGSFPPSENLSNHTREIFRHLPLFLSIWWGGIFPFCIHFLSPCQILLFFSSFSPIYPSFAFVLSLFSARSPLILLFLSKCLMFPSTSPSLNVLWTSFKYFLLLPTRRLSRCL